ncbi:hypothetical protein [Phascolarctobacterium sp.]
MRIVILFVCIAGGSFLRVRRVKVRYTGSICSFMKNFANGGQAVTSAAGKT